MSKDSKPRKMKKHSETTNEIDMDPPTQHDENKDKCALDKRNMKSQTTIDIIVFLQRNNEIEKMLSSMKYVLTL